MGLPDTYIYPPVPFEVECVDNATIADLDVGQKYMVKEVEFNHDTEGDTRFHIVGRGGSAYFIRRFKILHPVPQTVSTYTPKEEVVEEVAPEPPPPPPFDFDAYNRGHMIRKRKMT
jgi:hypothetical protein